MKLTIIVLVVCGLAAGCTKKIKYCGQEIREDTRVIYCMGKEFDLKTGLKGLERFKRLQYLYLDRAPVVDVAPLAKLSELRLLYLQWTRVHDIRPLAGLRKLESLSIAHTNVTDISALRSLKTITMLKIGGLRLRDASPIYALPLLRELQIAHATVPASQVTALENYLKAKKITIIPF